MRNVTHKITAHAFQFILLGHVFHKYKSVIGAKSREFKLQTKFRIRPRLHPQGFLKILIPHVPFEGFSRRHVGEWFPLLLLKSNTQQILRSIVAPNQATIRVNDQRCIPHRGERIFQVRLGADTAGARLRLSAPQYVYIVENPPHARPANGRQLLWLRKPAIQLC